MESHRASKEASSRGLRPGDPLSPALFVIAAEVFSRSLNLLLVNPSFYPYAVPRGCPFITHLGYADDIIIFSSGTRKSLDAVMKVIHSYERCSGLLVNVQKSCFVLSPKAYPKRKEITGFYQTYQIPGLSPICWEEDKSSLFWYAGIDHRSKKCLSSGGRITLIRHVLSSVPIQIFAVLERGMIMKF